MVNIKKSEIKALLTAYHRSRSGASLENEDRQLTHRNLPRFIANLEKLSSVFDRSSLFVDELTPRELFELLTLLLTRKKQIHASSKKPKRSERLACMLEEKFGKNELKKLKKYFNLNTLSFDKFFHLYRFRKYTSHEMNIILTTSKSLSEKMALSKISHHHHRLFSNENTIYLPLLRQLLSHCALGELAKAEDIWRKHPALLDCYGTIYHPNLIYDGDKVVRGIARHYNPGCYEFNGLTPLQILWVNSEYEAAKYIEEILGPQETARQFFEVFPDGVIKKDNFNLEHAITLLNKVFKAIVNDKTINAANLDQMNEVTRKALFALQNYAKIKFVHKTGLVFDPRFYLAALKLYDRHACDYFKQNFSKYDFWCIRVKEWLAGCLGTGYLRLHAQGFGNYEVRHRRGCILINSSTYFAFRRDGDSILGLHCFVGYHGQERRAGRQIAWDARNSLGIFQTLCHEKDILAGNLCNRVAQTMKQTHGL